MNQIHIHGRRPAPLADAICPACGRQAIALGDDLYHCGSCGRVGTEPIGLKHFLHADGHGCAVDSRPRPEVNIRWACGVIAGCTHDTEADANRHRASKRRLS